MLAIILAAAIGIPAAFFSRGAQCRRWALGITNIVQTIPSLALFGFLMPVPLIGGIGKRTAIVALVLYALLPMLRKTRLSECSASIDAVRESAVAMGMTQPAASLAS